MADELEIGRDTYSDGSPGGFTVGFDLELEEQPSCTYVFESGVGEAVTVCPNLFRRAVTLLRNGKPFNIRKGRKYKVKSIEIVLEDE